MLFQMFNYFLQKTYTYDIYWLLFIVANILKCALHSLHNSAVKDFCLPPSVGSREFTDNSDGNEMEKEDHQDTSCEKHFPWPLLIDAPCSRTWGESSLGYWGGDWRWWTWSFNIFLFVLKTFVCRPIDLLWQRGLNWTLSSKYKINVESTLSPTEANKDCGLSGGHIDFY